MKSKHGSDDNELIKLAFNIKMTVSLRWTVFAKQIDLNIETQIFVIFLEPSYR